MYCTLCHTGIISRYWIGRITVNVNKCKYILLIRLKNHKRAANQVRVEVISVLQILQVLGRECINVDKCTIVCVCVFVSLHFLFNQTNAYYVTKHVISTQTVLCGDTGGKQNKYVLQPWTSCSTHLELSSMRIGHG